MVARPRHHSRRGHDERLSGRQPVDRPDRRRQRTFWCSDIGDVAAERAAGNEVVVLKPDQHHGCRARGDGPSRWKRRPMHERSSNGSLLCHRGLGQLRKNATLVAGTHCECSTTLYQGLKRPGSETPRPRTSRVPGEDPFRASRPTAPPAHRGAALPVSGQDRAGCACSVAAGACAGLRDSSYARVQKANCCLEVDRWRAVGPHRAQLREC